MGFARFNLYAQSFILHLTDTNTAAFPFKTAELASLIGFWGWYLTLMSFLPSYLAIVVYTLVSHVTGGILHVQITLSHFAEPVETDFADKPYNFVETQVLHSIDIDCPRWLDW